MKECPCCHHDAVPNWRAHLTPMRLRCEHCGHRLQATFGPESRAGRVAFWCVFLLPVLWLFQALKEPGPVMFIPLGIMAITVIGMQHRYIQTRPLRTRV